MSIQHLIHTYGYLAVFVLVLVESFGVPIPGETSLIAAATYAGATHPHRLSVWLIFAVAAVAGALGGMAGYWIGDWGGYRLLCRWGPAIHLDEPKVKVARYLFDRQGVKVVFFGRFVSVLRAYASFLAGTVRMRFRLFAPANVAGAVAWSALYAFGAYWAGSTLKSVSTPLDIALGVVAVAVVVTAVLVVRAKMGSLVARAEAKYPGPLEP